MLGIILATAINCTPGIDLTLAQLKDSGTIDETASQVRKVHQKVDYHPNGIIKEESCTIEVMPRAVDIIQENAEALKRICAFGLVKPVDVVIDGKVNRLFIGIKKKKNEAGELIELCEIELKDKGYKDW